MRAVLSGIVVALAIAVLAALVLNETQRASYDVYTAHQSVRLGDPGHNLVGPPRDAKL